MRIELVFLFCWITGVWRHDFGTAVAVQLWHANCLSYCVTSLASTDVTSTFLILDYKHVRFFPLSMEWGSISFGETGPILFVSLSF